jgi:hypothetical protein
LVAEYLKKQAYHGLADFQDPWTQVDYYKMFKITKCADKKHRKTGAGNLSEPQKNNNSKSNLGKRFGKHWSQGC